MGVRASLISARPPGAASVHAEFAVGQGVNTSVGSSITLSTPIAQHPLDDAEALRLE